MVSRDRNDWFIAQLGRDIEKLSKGQSNGGNRPEI